jgi:hypothetical protein
MMMRQAILGAAKSTPGQVIDLPTPPADHIIIDVKPQAGMQWQLKFHPHTNWLNILMQ